MVRNQAMKYLYLIQTTFLTVYCSAQSLEKSFWTPLELPYPKLAADLYTFPIRIRQSLLQEILATSPKAICAYAGLSFPISKK